ncbi:uncharacterized protein HD556DRAFT_1496530 [Suillus plorans]|uniref:Uncharacterized protein n=1 Tax=Suillus plorans TaxID=116603 RepID=A0A9P7AFW6_9AGAM|nr:uncharacterized protein HD556DRAFT_1496530 [Suillus plorans]KAG1788625.1 hypothetical protein HD556DRAFT_1496530 [Suillus plorans]
MPKLSLAASEGSWKQQKKALDKEIADLNARQVPEWTSIGSLISFKYRSRDLSVLNALLHQDLETVSTQATCIRQAADSSATDGASGDADIGDDVDTQVSELRSVVAYLRKEKEIVDLQLELSKQENVRLKAQIEHLIQSLQETRATLVEERERAIEAATSDAQHTEMLERINQFNTLWESNVTLRAGCETYAKCSRELNTKLQALSAELEPSKEQARMAQAELGARDAQITHLEGESRHWQERNAQLLSKYDRTDPAEIQILKDEIETLKIQKADAEKLATEHEERANTIQARRHYSKRVALEQVLANERAVKAQASAEGSSDQTTLIASLREERDRLLAEKEALSKAGSSTVPSDTARSWELEKLELIKARDEASAPASVGH